MKSINNAECDQLGSFGICYSNSRVVTTAKLELRILCSTSVESRAQVSVVWLLSRLSTNARNACQIRSTLNATVCMPILPALCFPSFHINSLKQNNAAANGRDISGVF